VVKFDRRIEPGQTGYIRLSVRTSPGWAGRRFTKRASVSMTDPAQAGFFLTLTGRVKGPPPQPAPTPPGQTVVPAPKRIGP